MSVKIPINAMNVKKRLNIARICLNIRMNIIKMMRKRRLDTITTAQAHPKSAIPALGGSGVGG